MILFLERFCLQKVIPPSKYNARAYSFIIPKDPTKSFFDQVPIIMNIFPQCGSPGHFLNLQKNYISEVFGSDYSHPNIVSVRIFQPSFASIVAFASLVFLITGPPSHLGLKFYPRISRGLGIDIAQNLDYYFKELHVSTIYSFEM